MVPCCAPSRCWLPSTPQGEWQGLVRSQCYTPELTAAFTADPWGTAWHFTPPGGESQHAVEARMTAYILGEVLPGLTPEAPAVLVGHGMAIKVCRCHRVGTGGASVVQAMTGRP